MLIREKTMNDQDTKKVEAEIRRLKQIREEYALMSKNMNDRERRLNELMERPSAKKWSPKKLAKMARRLVEVEAEARNAAGVVEQADFKLRHAAKV